MADVFKLVQNAPVRGEDAKAKVIAALRTCADAIESGEEKPAHKVIVVLYEDVGEQFAVRSRFCNVTAIERAGMLAMAVHDTLTEG